MEISQLATKDLLAQRQQILIQLKYNEIIYHRTAAMRQQSAASHNELDATKRDFDVAKQQLADIDVKIKSNRS